MNILNIRTKLVSLLLILFIFPVNGQTTLWNFHTNLEGWTLDNHVSGEVSDGILHLNITGNDPYIGSPGYLNIPARDYKYFIIRMQNGTTGTGADLFWTNANGLHFTSISVKASQDSMQYYIVDLSRNPDWSGTIHSMRMDPPGSSGSVSIDFIKLAGSQESYPEPKPDDNETPGQKPFHGSPISIPGIVQAEDFDTGGEGVAYLDKSSVNEGGAYRTDEGVDIHEGGSGFVTGWAASDEWLEYTVNVEKAGYYLINIQYFTLLENQKIQLSVDENTVTDIITLPFSDGNIANHEEIIYLSSGVQVLRIHIVNATGGLDLDFIEFTSLVSNEKSMIIRDAFSIYPNPANERLYVQINDSYQEQKEAIRIVITDLQGRTVKSEFITLNQLDSRVKEIDIRSLKPGVYIVSLITPEKLLVNRFLKK